MHPRHIFLIIIATIGSGCSDVLKPFNDSNLSGGATFSNLVDAKIEIRNGGGCFYTRQGKKVIIKNTDTGNRIYVTIKYGATPSQFPIINYDFSKQIADYPKYKGFLLLPGEERIVGCEAGQITGKRDRVEFTYTVAGSYIPQPDLNFPDNDRPEDFVRFIISGKLAPAEWCGTAEDASTVHVENIHPSRSVTMKVFGVPGNPSHIFDIASRAPGEGGTIGCDNGKLKLKDIEFIN